MTTNALVKGNVIIATLGIVWLAGVGLGIKMVWDYAALAGESASPPGSWPADCAIQRASDRATLVLLAHPRCPCTRATIRELALLMTRCKGKVAAYVALYKPTDASDDWTKTDLWNDASAIPDVSVMTDADGSLARTFNAATSGQAILYDSQGNLLFAGGITSARGHSGDNSGRTTIVSLLNDETAELAETPVFGCPIFDPHSECHGGAHQ